ncbi:MAG TPA: hypothetical protein ENI76_02835 [Ignavibacteria bacterium]|nr:hypothetical protein [Ignavibacteria bacterium]
MSDSFSRYSNGQRVDFSGFLKQAKDIARTQRSAKVKAVYLKRQSREKKDRLDRQLKVSENDKERALFAQTRDMKISREFPRQQRGRGIATGPKGTVTLNEQAGNFGNRVDAAGAKSFLAGAGKGLSLGQQASNIPSPVSPIKKAPGAFKPIDARSQRDIAFTKAYNAKNSATTSIAGDVARGSLGIAGSVLKPTGKGILDMLKPTGRAISDVGKAGKFLFKQRTKKDKRKLLRETGMSNFLSGL